MSFSLRNRPIDDPALVVMALPEMFEAPVRLGGKEQPMMYEHRYVCPTCAKNIRDWINQIL